MACELCEHCQSPVSRDERITVHEGFSYHKRCHKCYVCSETNLLNAEVFKGVIFCSSCAQRIFQGCSTARRTKTTHGGRMKRARSRSHRRREKGRVQDRKPDRSRDCVIKMAGMAESTTTDSDDLKKEKLKSRKSSMPMMSQELALLEKKEAYEEDRNYLQRLKQLKKDSTEMGTTTDVTQELLRQINCPIPDCRAKECAPKTIFQPRKHHRRKETIEPDLGKYTRNKPICSDLRIAELGASTEIANMALRKKSEVPVIIKSNTRLKRQGSYSLSMLNQESDISGDGWMDSVYSTIDEISERQNMMDRRLGSILRMPLKFFKKNILARSSLISVLMSTDDARNINILRKLKDILYEEVTAHQSRGVTRLYSTINRRKTPYKLGWIDLVANVSKVPREPNHSCVLKERCKHFRASHSYRCMRAQVMKLAGPTKSQLACYRNKIKKFIAPQFLRNIVNSTKQYPAIKMSQACGSDRTTTITHNLQL